MKIRVKVVTEYEVDFDASSNEFRTDFEDNVNVLVGHLAYYGPGEFEEEEWIKIKTIQDAEPDCESIGG